MSFYYDEELPAGFQDADFEMAEYEAEAYRIEADRKRGICHHTGTLGRGDGNGHLPGGFYYEGQEEIPPGHVRCTDVCGKIIPDPWK